MSVPFGQALMTPLELSTVEHMLNIQQRNLAVSNDALEAALFSTLPRHG
jgi:hypothetical protein